MRKASEIRAELYGKEGAHVRWLTSRYGYVLSAQASGLLADRWPSGSTRVSFRKLLVGLSTTEWQLRKRVNVALARLEKEHTYTEEVKPENRNAFRWARRERTMW